MHTQLIAITLTSLGFIAQITTGGVLVSLKRPVNSMEVELALMQEFGTIEFQVKQVGNSVLVQE